MIAPEPAISRPSPTGFQASRTDPAEPRHDWTREEITALFELPFPERGEPQLVVSGGRPKRGAGPAADRPTYEDEQQPAR